MGNLKYTTLLDYIIKILKMVKVSSPNSYVSLVSLLKYFSYNASIGEIQEIGKYLEARGWAKIVFLLGDVRAQITTAGLVYMEEKENEQFNREFLDFFADAIKGKDPKEAIIQIFSEQESGDPKKNILELLEKVEDKIKERQGDIDLLKDVQVIKLELSKVTPDFKLIEIKLNGLTQLAFVSSEIQELKDYLNISN